MAIDSLTDIPLVNGIFFCRWKVKSALNDHRGSTQSIPIIDHTVNWNNTFTIKVVLVIGRDDILLPCPLSLSIKKETHGGKKAETIGKVMIDLAEFAGSKFSTRQYLLQESKMNSTLKISIDMKQVHGDTLFKAPEPNKNQTNFGLKNIFQRSESDDDDLNDIVFPKLKESNSAESLQAEYEDQTPAELVEEIFRKLEEKERERLGMTRE